MLRPLLAPIALAVGGLAAVTLATTAHAQAPPAIKRVDRPTTTIANIVTVPPGYATLYISGTTSGSGGTPTPPGSDTKAQTVIIYEKFTTWLASEGLTMGDIVSMRVYLVADQTKGRMDTAGANAAYDMFFGTAAQPNKPARATIQVAALGGPTTLVEIEAVAAKRP
jgi:enamine deaminase RidA (YjgF/YER057c/UK114 family)